jgi:hypothetical protein
MASDSDHTSKRPETIECILLYLKSLLKDERNIKPDILEPHCGRKDAICVFSLS